MDIETVANRVSMPAKKREAPALPPVMRNPGQRLEGVLLDLYRCASSTPPEAFNDSALELLQSVVHFDAAWWGQTEVDPAFVMQGAHLYNVAASIFADYRRIDGEDILARALIDDPGTTTMMNGLFDREGLDAIGGMKEYLRRYRVHALLSTGLQVAPQSPHEFMTIWRFDPRWPFSESDRAAKEVLFPHLLEARRINRWIRLDNDSRPNGAWALADEAGNLFEVGAEFVHAVRAEWPAWQNPMLPTLLVRRLMKDGTYQGRQVRIWSEPAGGLQLLRARLSNPGERLGKREREIALAFADGESYVTISTRFGLAPSTVRTHLQRIYRKLDVHNKSELARLFRR